MDPNWIMVIITGVYVIATVFICVANFKSASATKEQLTESQRQYEENNRAFVTADFEIIRNGLLTIHIENHGKRIANNVNVHVCEEFIKTVKTPFYKTHMQKMNHSKFTLGIGQSWYLSFGTNLQLEALSNELLRINITYSDSENSYDESTVIDLKQYHWALLYESPTQDEYQEIKKISKHIESIDNTLKKSKK